MNQEKMNALLDLIKEQDSGVLTAIDEIYLHVKDVNEPKQQSLIKKRENAGIKHLSRKAFIE